MILRRLRTRIGCVVGIFFTLGFLAYSYGENQSSQHGSDTGKAFVYMATRFGVPILKATITITNGSIDHGKAFLQVQAFFQSLRYLGLLFRMNNRFTSTVEAETCSPVRYVKEVDQEGLLIKKKHYLRTFSFNTPNKMVMVEKMDKKEEEEVPLPPGTYDPLSVFARFYLKESLHPGQDIHMSIFDGFKLRRMVFHSKKEKVSSKMYGEVQAVCLESSTPFSSFGEKEGIIRIWYINGEEKTPILMELDLPIGNIKFELDSINRS